MTLFRVGQGWRGSRTGLADLLPAELRINAQQGLRSPGAKQVWAGGWAQASSHAGVSGSSCPGPLRPPRVSEISQDLLSADGEQEETI